MGNRNISSIDKLADTANTATDTLADKAESTVDSARSFANEALDKADAKVRSLRDDIKPAIDAISARVQVMAEQGKAAASDTTAQAREKFNDVAHKTSAYVAEQPMKSMAIAAAAGAVVAMLLGRRRK
ncbi:glycine zipper domain-containing protein [Ottowia thiooxydans]|uniref:glycine zipper domain-containing protein n=1 Tax=Ottowia thiooxydans TaxID=219182 RepID=UPI0003FB8B15|nr:DUF883 family protein [Ottowia thiooxydans]